jgi:hypothetical protein
MPGRDDSSDGFWHLGRSTAARCVDSGADSAWYSHVWRGFHENHLSAAGNCAQASAIVLRVECPDTIAATNHSSLHDRKIEPQIENPGTCHGCFDRSTRDRANSRIAASDAKRREGRASGGNAAAEFGKHFFGNDVPTRWRQ